MPKKSGKKCPTTAPVAVAEAGDEEKKPSSSTPTKKQKPRDEIDEIFASKKRKKPADQEDETKKKQQRRPAKDGVDKMMKKNKSKKIPKRENGSGSGKRTKEGFAIYTEEELRIGKADAGGTPLCPFDCDCCF